MSINYDIVNYKKIDWYETQTYKFDRDDNNGYLYGCVEWYGDQDLDDTLQIYGGENVNWSWFKTEEERDRVFKEDSND